MPLPRHVVRIAVGSDTRDNSSTPPDPRRVEDLMTALDDSVVGGTLARNTYWSTEWTLSSSATPTTLPVTSGAIITDDGGWNTTYDCYVPPSGWFDDYTYVQADLVWTVEWPMWSGGNSFGNLLARFNILPSASSSTASAVSVHEAGMIWQERNAYSLNPTHGGTVPVRFTEGQAVEFQLAQTSGTSMTTIAASWGVRLIGATD